MASRTSITSSLFVLSLLFILFSQINAQTSPTPSNTFSSTPSASFTPAPSISPSPSSVPLQNPCINAGDTGWVLLATILVLGMMPALAFFEAGLLRRKNTLSIITEVIVGLSSMELLWFVLSRFFYVF